MGRLSRVLTMVAACSLAAAAQITPLENVVSDSSSSLTPATPSTKPAAETPDIVVDPASLLPDLPKLPSAKASLIGGTIGKLDRVRDQMTVEIFGGGKMTIAFDPRTHVLREGVEAPASDLRLGDRVYVETILDGSAVFARTIRLKTSTFAGESQGIVTNYRAGKGELEIRDALSPQAVKIRVSSQTRILQGNHSAAAGILAPGTLVAVKFGPHGEGEEIAREISVLAVPGEQFTFAGQVTAIDLRLGLIVLMSSTDHKSYEVYVDPSVVAIDDNVRPSVDVTVLTRFEGNKYVARSITVNSPNRQ